MLAIRPTFSESWYRVANLRVRLRASAQISRQHYRGERWYVVRDPAGNQFHRLSDSAYRFVGLLDGSRTVEEAWDLCGGQLADDAPTQPEVIQILSHLYAANLVDADVTPDATVLLRRHKQQAKKKMHRRLMNIFFPRLPIWDPDRFLKRWMPLVEKIFSTGGAIAWLLVMGLALLVVIPRMDLFKTDAARAVDLYNNTINVLWLYLTFVFIKAIHELGHAFACRRFGGECHELGIMLLIFVPTPYVDASAAWAFPSKWQRIFVGAAGMIVELFFAALCAFIWAFTDPYSFPHQLAYNAMLVASVTTIIFNANPLLRYDGYYILSDWLEIPNLRQKSTEYSLGLIKRHVFRVKAQQPLPPAMQRFWLLTYAILSSIYRVFVSIMIMLVVAFQIPILGALMAIGMGITFVVVPVVQVFRYLTVDPELHRKRGRAIAFSVAVTAAIVIGIGVIPMSYTIYSNGIVRPAKMETVRASEAGFISRVMVHDGQWVTKGTPICQLRNDELDMQVAQLETDLAAQKIMVQAARGAGDPAKQAIEQYRQQNIQEQLDHMKARQKELSVVAPFDGVFVNAQWDQVAGQYIGPANEFTIGTLMTMHEIEVRSVLEQRDATRVTPDSVADIQVRLMSDVGTTLKTDSIQVSRSVTPELASAVLGSGAGGDVAVDPSDPEGKRAMVDQFEMRLRLVNPDGRYFPGQRAVVRLKLKDKMPLIAQWSIRFWQLIQTHAAQAKM